MADEANDKPKTRYKIDNQTGGLVDRIDGTSPYVGPDGKYANDWLRFDRQTAQYNNGMTFSNKELEKEASQRVTDDKSAGEVVRSIAILEDRARGR